MTDTLTYTEKTEFDGVYYAFGPDNLSNQLVLDTIADVAKAAGWTVARNDDGVIAASREVHPDRDGRRPSSYEFVTVKPTTGEDQMPLPAARQRGVEQEATTSVRTIVGWLISSAVIDAELRGAEGGFTA